MKSRQIINKFLKINYRHSLGFISIAILQSIFIIFNTILNIYIPKASIDYLILGNYRYAIYSLLFLSITNGSFYFLNKFFKIKLDIESIKIKEAAENKLSDKLMSIEFENLENPEILDLKEKAIFPISNQGVIETFFLGIKDIIQSFFILVSVSFILIKLSPYLLIALLIISLINLLILKNFNRYLSNFYSQLLPINRRFNYYLSTNFEVNYREDIRFFNMNKIMTKKIDDYSERTYEFLDEVARETGRTEGKQTILSSLQSGLSYFFIAIKSLSRGSVSLGSFSAYISSAKSFSENFNLLINYYAVFIQQLSYLQPYIQLMDIDDYDNKGKKVKINSINSIEFKNVFFKYPRSDEYTLKNVSFLINKGEKLSLVGRNGAGKTTVVKLISGLYQPESGEILVNNIDLKDIDINSYNNLISAIFQDFKLLPISIEKNIIASEEYNQMKFNKSLDEIGILSTLEELNYGEDTIIGKSFHKNKGKDFSGGQLQKMAIARALYKEGDLIILDEPTSALDPIAEAEIYESFHKLVGNKMALYISHRMSSSKFVDRIIVLDKGEIVEDGSHQELLKKESGIYQSLYNKQYEYYKNN